jgi:hypothetical protein
MLHSETLPRLVESQLEAQRISRMIDYITKFEAVRAAADMTART